jgi:hypothetical protein
MSKKNASELNAIGTTIAQRDLVNHGEKTQSCMAGLTRRHPVNPKSSFFTIDIFFPSVLPLFPIRKTVGATLCAPW